MNYEIDFTSQFKRDVKLAKKQGRDIDKLIVVIDELACEKELSSKYKNHVLQGDYVNCRECHIGLDWLLIYRIVGSVIVFVRIGTHSQLFK